MITKPRPLGEANTTMNPHYAYVTGAASGLGLKITKFLVSEGIKVFITDLDRNRLQEVSEELNVPYSTLDVTKWESQVAAFEKAVEHFGRIDYVYPIAGIGERDWLLSQPAGNSGHFLQPDLAVMDVNTTGLLYTVALAVQQFKRQTLDEHGFRGKILCAASVCGLYCCPSLPIYTTSKHAIIGLVRSYGKQLLKERITMNAFCPNVMRTSFTTGAFYDSLEAEGLLSSAEGVVEVTKLLLGNCDISAECFEIGPNYAKGQGLIRPEFLEFVDDETKRVFDKLERRGNAK